MRFVEVTHGEMIISKDVLELRSKNQHPDFLTDSAWTIGITERHDKKKFAVYTILANSFMNCLI